MQRAIFLCAIFSVSVTALGAQQTNPSNPYEGVSAPPPNNEIIDEAPPQPKPPAAHPMIAPPAAPLPGSAQQATPPAATAGSETARPGQIPPDFITSTNSNGTDAGIVEPAGTAEPASQPKVQPTVLSRLYASDPDGDIVHPQGLPPGELGNGTVIRVRLLDELASGINQTGDTFRSRVIQDVLQDGSVLIPSGSEIDGKVVRLSTGEGLGSSGSMDLRPEAVILPDGTHYRMYAIVSGTPGSHTRVGAEGTVTPGAQWKRDGIDYGAGVGAGAATGAILGGPVGALAGTVIGAAAVTVHLLVSHPQATLDQGSTLEFTLTEPLNLVPVTGKGN